MKKAIYYRLIALTFIAISTYGLISGTIATVNNQNQIKSWLTNLTLSTAELYRHNSNITLLSQAAGNNRVTIIDPEGKVLADSTVDHELMENRGDREEFRYATRDSVFISIRTSYTLGDQFMYASILMEDDNILRIAYSYPRLLHNLIVQLPAMLIATFVAFILSLFFASRFTKTVTNPLEIVMTALAEREYKQLRNYQSPYEEVDEIMQSIDSLLQQISDSRQSLLIERGKINHILSNMAEGFVLIDHDENILLCNNSVKNFFACKDELIAQSLITIVNDKSINIVVEKALG